MKPKKPYSVAAFYNSNYSFQKPYFTIKKALKNRVFRA